MSGRPIVSRALCLLVPLALLSLLTGGWPAKAQDAGYLGHGSWSTENGLPQNSVHQILQTKDGFLWVATEGGVSRFDGFTFKTFRHEVEPAFASNDACCLAQGPSGDLWVGTNDGLLRLRQGVFRRFAEQDGLPSAAILHLQVTGDGKLRVQTAAGIAQQDGDRFTLASATTLADGNDVELASERRRGSVWAMSGNAVKVTRPGHVREWKASRDLPGSRVESLMVDRQGNAWIGTNDGLALVRNGDDHAESIPVLRGNSVLQTYQDREGNYWIGTETTGLHLLHAEVFRDEPSVAGQAVTAVTQSSDGDIWLGTRNDGLRRLRGGRMTDPVRTGALTSPYILSLAPGQNGDLWAGTPDGLNRVDAAGNIAKMTSANRLPDDYIRALAAGADGAVWVGTRRGLARLQGSETKVFTHADGLGSDLIGSLLTASNGDLWAGTSGGLSRVGADGRLRNYDVRSGLSSPVVSALAEGPAGTIWIATGDGTLSRLQGGQIAPIQAAELKPGRIAALLVDRAGFLWIREERSIQRVAVSDLNGCVKGGNGCAARVSRYNSEDGMPSSEFVEGGSPLLWQMKNGEIWSATKRGLAVAASLPTDPQPFPVVIESMRADGSEQDLQHGPVDLAPGDTRVDIEYAGLSFAAPLQISYRYKLEGFDRDWMDVGTRRLATYTNLPPRSYTFLVEARGRDGAWLGAQAKFPFRVAQPFYRRWRFLLLVVVLLAGAAVSLYRLRLRMLRRQFDAVLGERNRMARAIHDTLAQDFVGVALQLDLVSQLLASGKSEAAERQVRSTRKLVTEGLAEARRSIWELRGRTSEDSLPTRLRALVDRYSGPSLKIELQVGGVYRPLDPWMEGEFLSIAQEALSNVQRHASADRASVQLHFGRDMLVLLVTDKGRGFTVGQHAMKQGHFGVSGMYERADAMGATLMVVSEPGKGTTVTLRAKITGKETRQTA